MEKIIKMCLCIFVALFISACSSNVRDRSLKVDEGVASYNEMKYGEFSVVNPVPMKDFITKGIIFVKATLVEDLITKEETGASISSEMIMREVQKLGGDDATNVRVDVDVKKTYIDVYGNYAYEHFDPITLEGREINDVVNKTAFLKEFLRKSETFKEHEYIKIETTYTCSALVIKYTNAITSFTGGPNDNNKDNSSSSSPLNWIGSIFKTFSK